MPQLSDIKLSAQDILQKQFKHKIQGNDPDEVDEYLNLIIKDYQTFGAIIEDLYGKIGELQSQLLEAQKAQTPEPEPDVKEFVPSRAQTIFNSQQPAGAGEVSTNVALIQRVSTLERKVFNLEQVVNSLQNK